MKITKGHIGKKVRDKQWNLGYWVRIEGVSEKGFVGFDWEGMPISVFHNQLDIEPYEEPKKEIKVAQARFKNRNGYWVVSTNLYPSLEKAKDAIPGLTVVWPHGEMVEVEE